MRLPKMDSFIRESQRLCPNNLLGLSRYCNTDVILSDGTLIPRGTSIGMLLYAMNRDAEIWESAEHFDGERFEKLRQQSMDKIRGSPGKGAVRWSLTHTDPEVNMNFGYGLHACPGRFLAASEVCNSLLLHLIFVVQAC